MGTVQSGGFEQSTWKCMGGMDASNVRDLVSRENLLVERR